MKDSHKNRDWLTEEDGAWSISDERARLAVLIDIRGELRKLNRYFVPKATKRKVAKRG